MINWLLHHSVWSGHHILGQSENMDKDPVAELVAILYTETDKYNVNKSLLLVVMSKLFRSMSNLR